MEQGNIASWLLKEGDKVSAGDVICQIETDKAVVDYEAQDDMYLAKILVPAGAEGIVVGQPIMVMCEDEDQLEGLKDFKVDGSALASPPAPKAPEEIPPKKEQVPVDPASNAPVVPQDFLVTAQTTAKVTKGTTAPPPAPVAPKPAAPKPAAAASAPATATSFAEKWGHGYKKSPISFRYAQACGIDRLTGC
jgi:pyruvate/2-oxoglutarate dehydrogenase complex dihydrolipoamide acyltransferase (E2) component